METRTKRQHDKTAVQEACAYKTE